jgi:hypothetical protein
MVSMSYPNWTNQRVEFKSCGSGPFVDPSPTPTESGDDGNQACGRMVGEEVAEKSRLGPGPEGGGVVPSTVN